MIGIGVEVGIWRLEQDHDTRELRLYKGGKIVYTGSSEKLYSMQELEELIFKLSREVENGIRTEDVER